MWRLWACLLLSLPVTAADVAVAPQSLTFAYQWRSSVPPAQQGILLTSAEPFTFTISRPAGDQWLALPGGTNTVTGQGPLFVPLAVDPGLLNPNTYRSTLSVRTTQGTIAIPVTFLLSLMPVMATDRGLLGLDPNATLLVVNTGLSNGATLVSTATASATSPWLSVTGGPFNFFVAADPVRAGPTLSAGSISLSGQAFGSPISNNPLVLPVIYMGSGLGSRPPLTVQPGAVAFTGSGTQQVTVTGPAFTATSDSPCATVSVSGQTLTVTGNPAGLEATSSQATIVLNSGGVLQSLPVSLTVGPPTLSKVVNAASYAESGIAPGEAVVLGGSNIGPCALTGLVLDANGFVSSTLAGVRVTFNGVAAPLIYVSATQIAAVAPYELDGRTSADVQVTVSGRASNTVTVPVVAAAPGIFTANASGTGPAALFRTGDAVSIFLTGEGQTTPAGVNGQVARTSPVPRQRVTATIDGQEAQVLFAGGAPDVVSGVMQVNLQPPPGIRSGPVPVVVTVGGVSTQSGVTVSVR
jgi:uncharacterized protein (TIGR03437 family)